MCYGYQWNTCGKLRCCSNHCPWIGIWCVLHDYHAHTHTQSNFQTTFSYAYTDTADEDYCSDSITVTIDDGDNDIACAEFSTKHDTDDEGEEEFFVEFSLPRPEPGVIIAPDLQVATVTILDNGMCIDYYCVNDQ